MQNLLDFYHKNQINVAVEIVANSVAVNFIKEDQKTILEELKQLAEQGVIIALCNNALGALCIAYSNVPEWALVVPAGVVELAERQLSGYAYIKP